MANLITAVSSTGGFLVLPSAARTATPTDTYEYELPGHARGLHLIIDATAVTSTPAVTVTVAGVDRVSGKTYTLLASTAIATAVTTVLKIGPGLPVSANVSANDLLPSVIRISVSHGNANSITYSIGGQVCS